MSAFSDNSNFEKTVNHQGYRHKCGQFCPFQREIGLSQYDGDHVLNDEEKCDDEGCERYIFYVPRIWGAGVLDIVGGQGDCRKVIGDEEEDHPQEGDEKIMEPEKTYG
jgi:hypothetical protein